VSLLVRYFVSKLGINLFLAKLVAGESVTSSTGKQVHPSEVSGVSKAAAVMIVVDCPSVDFIDSLIKSREFAPYYSERAAGCIFHMVSDDVLQDPRYQEWMNQFQEGAQHIICGGRYASRETFRVDSATLRSSLNLVDCDLFPKPLNPECVGGDQELLKSLCRMFLINFSRWNS
jgi:ribonuclease Z